MVVDEETLLWAMQEDNHGSIEQFLHEQGLDEDDALLDWATRMTDSALRNAMDNATPGQMAIALRESVTAAVMASFAIAWRIANADPRP